MSFTTFSLTMQDKETEELGANSNHQWQNYRIPLPTPPSSRATHTYDQHAPLSAPLTLVYHGGAPENYSSLSPPHHDMPSRRGSETVALAGSSRMHPQTALTSHRSYPTLKRPYGVFEESHYTRNPPFIQEGMPDTENRVTIQSDHRLTAFSPLLSQRTVVLDQYGGQAKIEVAAQIDGMFLVSEMPIHSGDGMIPVPEITCYRRNLFTVSGSVSRSAGALSVINDRNETVPVVSQELAISAKETADGNVIRLIVIPWKTPPVNSPEIPAGAEQEPIPIQLDFEGGEDEDKNSAMVTQQFNWKRLQFRVATANNGRRKELQQHFVLRLKVIATLADGTKACLNESTTCPIVVRGRSPRNFQSRKETPLVGASASPRGRVQGDIAPGGRVLGQVTTISPSAGRSSNLGPERMGSGSTSVTELPRRQFQFDATNFPPAPSAMRNGFAQWSAPPQHSDQNTGSTTPNSLPPSSSMAPYMNSIQAFQPIQESSAPAAATSQAASLDHQRHYYSSSSSLPGQYDSDERSTKSPRHSYMANSSTYQNFETPFNAALPSNSAGRGMYYSPAAQSQPWAPPPNSSANFAQALQPQPQHHHAQPHHSALPPPGSQSIQHHQQPAHMPQQQHHQPPPQPHQQSAASTYPYTSEAYPSSTREDPQNLNSYNWSPAGQ